MVLDDGLGIDSIDSALIEKKAFAVSIIDRDERTILGEEGRLSRQQKQFFKQTQREPLTINRQMNLAGRFGSSGVKAGAKSIFRSKKRARRITTPKFSRANKEIASSKKRIRERREAISSITKDTIVSDFGIDLSKFRVDTGFNF